MYYSKSSLIRFTKNGFEKHGFIAVSYDLSKVWNTFDEIPTENNIRYFLIHPVESRVGGKKYGFDIYLHPQCSTCAKKDPDRAKGIFAELIDNLDQILTGGYVSKSEISRRKKEVAEAKKEAKEKQLIEDCKTFNVDFFAAMSWDEGSYLNAIDEIGKRLQNGQYSNLILNDLITLSYRTKSKNRNLGYTVNVSIGEESVDFKYDSKEGDLWEDLDDNIHCEIVRCLMRYSRFQEDNVETSFSISKWVNQFAEKEKENDQNHIIYDLLSVYFSPDSFELDNTGKWYVNVYDKDNLHLGGVLREYFAPFVQNTNWINKELDKLSNVSTLKKYFDKK